LGEATFGEARQECARQGMKHRFLSMLLSRCEGFGDDQPMAGNVSTSLFEECERLVRSNDGPPESNCVKAAAD
jgi:hypothetical protein